MATNDNNSNNTSDSTRLVHSMDAHIVEISSKQSQTVPHNEVKPPVKQKE